VWLKILLNAGAIIQLIKALNSAGGSIYNAITKGERIPVCTESLVLLKAFKNLLERGFDIPGIDEKQLIVAIEDIEFQLQCKPN